MTAEAQGDFGGVSPRRQSRSVLENRGKFGGMLQASILQSARTR
jgi:hypothetical protein